MGAIIVPQTFLQLAQKLQFESGSTGSPNTTIANAVGEWKQMCNWIADSYVDIQLSRDDWDWMEQDVQFDTIAGQQAYPVATTAFTTPAEVGLADFRSWKLTSVTDDSSFRLYLASAGVNNETFLDGSLSYGQFRNHYQFGAKRNTQARPISISIAPDKSLLLGLTPNDVYTVMGKYYQQAQLLSVDGDIPAMPAQFHNLIVWNALEKYAFSESAPEVLAYANRMAKPLSYALDSAQLPDMELGDPLV